MPTNPKPRYVTQSAEQVRAIMDGTRREMREPVKPQPPAWANKAQSIVGDWLTFEGIHPPGNCGNSKCLHLRGTRGMAMFTVRSPFGAVGDVVGVRETWALRCTKDYLIDRCEVFSKGQILVGDAWLLNRDKVPMEVLYRADGGNEDVMCWRRSSNAPAWAIRLWTVNTAVRVEQDAESPTGWSWVRTFDMVSLAAAEAAKGGA